MSLAQAKSEFVSNVSHEIRTPLSLISMYAETLEMGRINEEKKKEYHSVIAKEAARLSGIVNRILNFSQIQANKKTCESKPVNLNELVDDVLKSYLFHMRDKGFVCEVIPPSSIFCNGIHGDVPVKALHHHIILPDTPTGKRQPTNSIAESTLLIVMVDSLSLNMTQ